MLDDCFAVIAVHEWLIGVLARVPVNQWMTYRKLLCLNYYRNVYG